MAHPIFHNSLELLEEIDRLNEELQQEKFDNDSLKSMIEQLEREIDTLKSVKKCRCPNKV